MYDVIFIRHFKLLLDISVTNVQTDGQKSIEIEIEWIGERKKEREIERIAGREGGDIGL